MKNPIVKGSKHLKTAFAKEVLAQTEVQMYEEESDHIGLNSDDFSILFHKNEAVLGWIGNLSINTTVAGNTVVYNLPQDWDKALQAVKDYYGISIGGYSAKVKSKNKIEFGCQTITRSEIESMQHMVSSPINMEAKIGNTKITENLLKKLLSLMDKYEK